MAVGRFFDDIEETGAFSRVPGRENGGNIAS